MTTSLTHTARTILRSRIRRHDKAASVLNGAKVSDMSTADLLQAATLLGLSAPTEAECAEYVKEKQATGSPSRALIKADGKDVSDPDAAGVGLSEMDAIDADDADQSRDDLVTDDQPVLALDPQATPAEKKADKAVDDIKAKVDASVRETLALMGAGNFEGFKDRLTKLAEQAHRPDPEPVQLPPVQVYDTSKLSGHVPSVVGRRTAKDMGLTSGGTGAKVTATALDVYDAPDAPARDPHYIWPDSASAILSQLARGKVAFLYGPAGTGKTSLAKQVAALWRRPFVRISCDDQTEAATLVGMTVPNGEGGVKWQDGQLTAAIRRPGTVILIDEPSVARPGALFVLQAVLDDDRRLHIAETGEVVQVAPGVLFLLADNTNGTGDVTGAYESTRRLNRAFLDRAGVTVKLDYMPIDQEAKAVASRTGAKEATALALCKFAALTRRKADNGEVSHGVGIRRLMSLAELVSDGVNPDMAFQMAVIETAPFDDREPLRQMWTAEVNKKALV